MTPMETIALLLREIYGEEHGRIALERISDLLAPYPSDQPVPEHYFSREDVVLITYGDTLNQSGETPLSTLKRFTDTYLTDAVSTIHLLPFFPYSSDDGFAVIDFSAVNPALGGWRDIDALGERFQLMFDWVLNHISAQSPWFENYLAGKRGFERLAVEVDPAADVSRVVRPRALPLLTPFVKNDGREVHLWTTFSDDQVDLNYNSIDVLIKMLEVMLLYVKRGAKVLRLDAVAYLAKEIGTASIHLPKTHHLVRLFRAVLDRAAPQVAILTETNVPHEENISYFGRGDEAQMVYNFSLPPLLLYTFITEDSRLISQWAKKLHTDFSRTTFFNFTASHDGIGVRPLEGILSASQLEPILQRISRNGGRVSFRTDPDGSQSPYELNITYFDAMYREGDSDTRHAARFLASQAIAMALPGVPGIYIHSLLGSRNWQEGIRKTGRARSINREKIRYGLLLDELEQAGSLRAKVFFEYLKLLEIRRRQPAFDPNAGCRVVDLNPSVFAMERSGDGQVIYVLTNVSSNPLTLSIEMNGGRRAIRDLISQKEHFLADLKMAPYQTLWLECC